MGEREDIRKRVESFRKMQERLCAEREARMNVLTQQTRKALLEIHANLSVRPERQ